LSERLIMGPSRPRWAPLSLLPRTLR